MPASASNRVLSLALRIALIPAAVCPAVTAAQAQAVQYAPAYAVGQQDALSLLAQATADAVGAVGYPVYDDALQNLIRLIAAAGPAGAQLVSQVCDQISNTQPEYRGNVMQMLADLNRLLGVPMPAYQPAPVLPPPVIVAPVIIQRDAPWWWRRDEWREHERREHERVDRERREHDWQDRERREHDWPERQRQGNAWGRPPVPAAPAFRPVPPPAAPVPAGPPPFRPDRDAFRHADRPAGWAPPQGFRPPPPPQPAPQQASRPAPPPQPPPPPQAQHQPPGQHQGCDPRSNPNCRH